MGSDDRDKPRGLATRRFGGTPFWDQFVGVARCCTELGNLTLIPTPKMVWKLLFLMVITLFRWPYLASNAED